MEDDLNKEKQRKLCKGFTVIFNELFNFEKIDLKTAYLFGLLYRLSRKNGYAYPLNKTLADMMDVSVSTVTRSLKILKDYHLISIEKVPSKNGTYSQRRIRVNTDFNRKTDDSICASTLVSGASHKIINKKDKDYVGHTVSLGFENRATLSYEQLCGLCEEFGNELICIMIYYISETLCASGKVYNDYYHLIRSKMNDNPKKYLSPNSDWYRHQKRQYQQYFDEFNTLVDGIYVEESNFEDDLI